MPLVSVVMPVYNSELYLAEAIESILAQTLTDFEFIIVDDGSTDRSHDIASAFEQHDHRVRCMKLDRNTGSSAARNQGLQAASSEYVAFMDADDVSVPSRLKKQIALLEQPGIDVVSCSSHLYNHDLTQKLSNRLAPPDHPKIVFNFFTGNRILYGGLMIARRDLLLKISGWNEQKRYGEEIDMFCRLLHHRVRFANVPEILYIQRAHQNNKSSNPIPTAARQRYEWHRQGLRMLWDDVSFSTLSRFSRFRRGDMLSWQERRAAKRDMRRIVKRIIDLRLIEASDRQLLHSEIDRKLERASPRIWQMFCHWRRHHFGGAIDGASVF